MEVDLYGIINDKFGAIDSFNQTAIRARVDICNRIWYNLDGVTAGTDVYNVFNVFVFVIDILIKTSMWMSCSNVFTIIFHGIAVNSDKQSEYECNCENNDHATVVVNNFHKIRITLNVIGFFVAVFHFIAQAIDIFLTISLPIKFEAFIAAICQLILIFSVPLPMNSVASHTQVIYNVYVCVVFSFLFSFVCNF